MTESSSHLVGADKIEPRPLNVDCIYNSCPEQPHGTAGYNKTSPHLHWINAGPYNAYKHGLLNVSQAHWGRGAVPDLVVAGINVGNNVWWDAPQSGNTAVAAAASVEDGIPSISFAADAKDRFAWNNRSPDSNMTYVYAQVATRIIEHIVKQPRPYLQGHTWLNINLPKFSKNCSNVDDFKYIATRMSLAVSSPPDPELCWTTRFPTEWYTKTHPGCYVSITPADAVYIGTVNDERVVTTLKKLKGLISCLPEFVPGYRRKGPVKGLDEAVPWDKAKYEAEKKKKEKEERFDG